MGAYDIILLNLGREGGYDSIIISEVKKKKKVFKIDQ